MRILDLCLTLTLTVVLAIPESNDTFVPTNDVTLQSAAVHTWRPHQLRSRATGDNDGRTRTGALVIVINYKKKLRNDITWRW